MIRQGDRAQANYRRSETLPYTLTRPVNIARELEGDYASSYTKLKYQPTILGAGYQNNLLKKHCKVYDNPDISAFVIM